MTLPNDDILLWAAFVKGDAAAERTLFQRFFRPLCFFSQQITGDRAQSEDVVIEALAAAFKTRARFENLSHFRRFLYKSVRNGSTNFIVRQKNISGIHDRIRASSDNDINEEHNPKDLEIIQAELLGRIYQEIEALPDKCRTIFKMIFIDHLNTEQIAGRLGINVQTVRSQKARALELLRLRLLKSGNIPLLLLLIDCMTIHYVINRHWGDSFL